MSYGDQTNPDARPEDVLDRASRLFRPGAEADARSDKKGPRSIPVSVFVSHSNKDAAFAIELAKEFNQAGFRAWTYETCLRFSKSIREEVWRVIADCDVFLVVDSPDARASGWVARELDKAKSLQRERRGPMPAILMVQLKNRMSKVFAGRDCNTGLPKMPHRFDRERVFCVENAHTDQLKDLIDTISPDVQFFGAAKGDSHRLPRGWVECYYELFPIKDERDHPADIMKWMEEAAEEPDADWEELVSTLSIVDHVVGFMYVSLHKPTGWVFGNYFGLRSAWRHHNWAKLFRDAVDAYMETRLTAPRGILFEVEPFSKDVAASAAAAIEKGRTKVTPSETPHACSVRRLHLYQAQGAYTLIDEDGEAAFYKQPSMRKSGKIDQKAEVPLLLMLYPHGRKLDADRHDPSSALDFVAEVFLDGYGDTPKKRAYILDVRDQIRAALPPSARWGEYMPEEAKDLLLQLLDKNIEVRL